MINPSPLKRGKSSVHDYIVNKMREVLSLEDEYHYVDQVAQQLLASARQVFRELNLDRQNIIPHGDGVILFPWVGTKKLTTLALAFQSREFKTTQLGFAIELQACEVSGVARYMKAFAKGDIPTTDALMSGVSKPNVAKFDGFLSWDLMTLVTVRERLEIDQLQAVAIRLGGLSADLAG